MSLSMFGFHGGGFQFLVVGCGMGTVLLRSLGFELLEREAERGFCGIRWC
jgi:hypothetical protein